MKLSNNPKNDQQCSMYDINVSYFTTSQRTDVQIQKDGPYIVTDGCWTVPLW